MVKNLSPSTRDARDAASISGSGRSPGVGNSNLTYSSVLSWKIPWTESLSGYIPLGHKELDMTEHACGEGNGTPLQYFCLENPVDGGAW